MRPLKKAVADTVTVSSATSGLVLAANERRKYALIGGNQTVGLWLALGEAAAVGSGIYLAAGDAYEIDADNLWLGEVYGILASGVDQTVGTEDMS